MAVIWNPYDRNKNKEAQGLSMPLEQQSPSQQTQPGMPQAPQQSTESATISAGSAAAPSTQPTKGPTSTGRLTNLRNYLEANKQKIGEMSGEIGKRVAEQGQQTQQLVESAKQQTISDITGATTGLQSTANTLGSAVIANPMALTSDQSTQAANILSGQYKGPTQLSNLSQVQSGLSNLGKVTAGSGTEEGRLGLLKSFLGSTSRSGLDQALLQGSGRIGDIRATATGYESAASKAKREAEALLTPEKLAEYQALAQSTKDMFSGKLGSGISDIYGSAGTKAEDLNKAADRIAAGLASGSLSKADADLLGLKGQEQLFNLSKLGAQGIKEKLFSSAATAAEVMSPEDKAKAMAIYNILGTAAPESVKSIVQEMGTSSGGMSGASALGAGKLSDLVAGDRDAYTAATQQWKAEQDAAEADVKKFSAGHVPVSDVYGMGGAKGSNVMIKNPVLWQEFSQLTGASDQTDRDTTAAYNMWVNNKLNAAKIKASQKQAEAQKLMSQYGAGQRLRIV